MSGAAGIGWYEAGQTPLTNDELMGLIPSLATREELNEWERENILEARKWALTSRNVKAADPLTDDYIRKLHRRMFDKTWDWAGSYRKTEKTLGVPVHEMGERLGQLLSDAKYWVIHETFADDEIAMRFHHRLVSIHLFANGNGRHGRMIADVLAAKLDRPVFTWGSRELLKPGEARHEYLEAMRAADAGEMAALVKFCRM